MQNDHLARHVYLLHGGASAQTSTTKRTCSSIGAMRGPGSTTRGMPLRRKTRMRQERGILGQKRWPRRPWHGSNTFNVHTPEVHTVNDLNRRASLRRLEPLRKRAWVPHCDHNNSASHADSARALTRQQAITNVQISRFANLRRLLPLRSAPHPQAPWQCTRRQQFKSDLNCCCRLLEMVSNQAASQGLKR